MKNKVITNLMHEVMLLKDSKNIIERNLVIALKNEETAIAQHDKLLALLIEADEYLTPKVPGQINQICTRSILHCKIMQDIAAIKEVRDAE
jgi:hypothetical protein